MQRFPVTVAYHLDDKPEAKPIAVQTAAADAAQAAAVAQILAAGWIRMRHPGMRARIPVETLQVGAPAGVVGGVHAYVLTTRPDIACVELPGQLEAGAQAAINAMLDAAPIRGIYGIIADVSAAPKPSTEVVVAFTRAADTHRLRLVRSSQGLTETITRAGLANRLRSFPDLQRAVLDLCSSWLQVAETIPR